jgi:hypothetical protein
VRSWDGCRHTRRFAKADHVWHRKQRASYGAAILKKKSRQRSEALPSVSLYRDDVEEAIAILAASGAKVVVSDADYEYDSLDEFITHRGKSPRVLRLDTTAWDGPSLSVRRHRFAGVFLSSTDEGTYLRLKDLLRRRRTVLSRALGPWLWFGIAGVAVLLQLAQALRWIPFPDFSFLQWVGWLSLLMANLGLAFRGGFFSRVYLGLRHEATSFWSRNAEKLTIALVAAALGALGKALADRILERLAHGPH